MCSSVVSLDGAHLCFMHISMLSVILRRIQQPIQAFRNVWSPVLFLLYLPCLTILWLAAARIFFQVCSHFQLMVHVIFCLCPNESSVGLKIGSNFVRVHDAISITAKIDPPSCTINQPMQPVINGVATFSQAIFSGFVGQCIMHFEARFHENLNPMASDQPSANIVIRVIATAMLIQRQLPAQILVGETAYSFTGWNIYM